MLFDNDTAGHEELALLKRKPIPSNVFATALPPLEEARSHPTILPDGSFSLTDVNEIGCALELYLGSDVLVDEKGARLPVRLKGFNTAMKRHQGQLDDKPGIQKRIRSKLRRAREDSSSVVHSDFSGLGLILNSIFAAIAAR